jgi:hypothetical protein
MRRVINVRDIGSTCTCSVGVMSIVLTRVTGPESAVVESAGTGCTNRVGVELLGTGFVNAMRTRMIAMSLGSGSMSTALANAGWMEMRLGCADGMVADLDVRLGLIGLSPGSGSMRIGAAGAG